MRKRTPSTIVGMSQLRSPRRSPRLIALTASCMVTLDTSSSIVLRVGRPMPRIGSTCQVGFSPNTGSQSGMRARRKKYVVKSAPKKNASLETNRMTAHIPAEKRDGCASRPVSFGGRRSAGSPRRPRTTVRSSSVVLICLVVRSISRLGSARVGARVVDEPGRDADDHDHGAEREKDRAKQDSERDHHHAESEDRRGEAPLRKMDGVVVAVMR